MNNLPRDLITPGRAQDSASPNQTSSCTGSQGATPSPTDRPGLDPTEINIIEFKFVRDTDPTSNATDPSRQHSRLSNLLRTKHPQAIIHSRSILLGIAGTIYDQDTITQLHQVGVRGTQLKSTIQKLQRIAIQDLHATWLTRQSKIRPKAQARGTTTHLDQGTTRPHPDGGNPNPPGRATPGTLAEGMDEAREGEGRRAGEATPFRRTWCSAERWESWDGQWTIR
jgi:hypothetical protein